MAQSRRDDLESEDWIWDGLLVALWSSPANGRQLKASSLHCWLVVWHALQDLNIHSWLPAGVSAASIVDLQAQLYQAQEAARLAKEGNIDVGEKHARRRAGVDVKGLLGPSNPGVQARDQRDRLHVKVCNCILIQEHNGRVNIIQLFTPLHMSTCCCLRRQ